MCVTLACLMMVKECLNSRRLWVRTQHLTHGNTFQLLRFEAGIWAGGDSSLDGVPALSSTFLGLGHLPTFPYARAMKMEDTLVL